MKRPARRSAAPDAAFARLVEPFGSAGLDGLLDAALDAGLLITTDRRIRFFALAWRLADAGITFRDAQDAAATFGSVLCTGLEDQALFARVVEGRWRAPTGTAKLLPGPRPAPLPEPQVPRAGTRPVRIAILIIVVLTLVIGVVWLLGSFGPPATVDTKPPSDPTLPVGQYVPAALDLLGRVLLALPGLIGAWLAWSWWRPPASTIVRERGEAKRTARFTSPDRVELYRGPRMRLAFDALRRAVRVYSGRLDVLSSLRATVRAAGWPSIRYATRRVSVEVVLFVDREGVADHIAFLASVLEERLRAAGANVTRYDYRIIPTRLTQVSGRPAGTPVEDLERVVARHVGHRLILLGDAGGLVDGLHPDDERSMRLLLHEFAQVLVLTPTPRDAWGYRERALLQSGFHVATADREGVEETARMSTIPDWSEPLIALQRTVPEDADAFLARLERDRHRYAADYRVREGEGVPQGVLDTYGVRTPEIRWLVTSLQSWMGSRAAFRLLVAVAVFPEIRPAHTLAIADALAKDPQAPGPRLDEALYARLARLPWLRDGRFPDWLRLALARRLDPAERRAVARAHVAVLAPMVLAGGAALAGAALEIALRDLRANMSADHPLAERLFLANLYDQSLTSDLLRPQATAAITEALGRERRLAPRIVAAGFLVLALAAFLLKDSVVLPAFMAAGAWLSTNVAPLLPVGGAAAVCRWAAIVLTLFVLWGTIRPGAGQSAQRVTLGQYVILASAAVTHHVRLAGSRFQVPHQGFFIPAFEVELTELSPHTKPFWGVLFYEEPSNAWPRLLLRHLQQPQETYYRVMVRAEISPFAARLTAALVALTAAVLGLWDGSTLATDFSIAVFNCAAVGLAAILFSRHPASGAGLWVVPDVDRVTAYGISSFGDYPLGRAIAARAMVGPVLAGTAVALLFFGSVALSLFLLSERPTIGPPVTMGVTFAILVPSLVLRRFVLGTWFMPDPDRRGNRHPVADLVWAASLASFADLCVASGASFNSTRALLAFLAIFFVIATLAVICVLALQPLRAPSSPVGEIRANLGAVMIFCLLGEVALWVGFGFVFISVVTGDLRPALLATSLLLVLPILMTPLQVGAAVLLTPISGVSLTVRDRLKRGLQASPRHDWRLWLLIVWSFMATLIAVALITYWIESSRVDIEIILGSIALLAVFIGSGPRLWLAVRWLGIVPLVMELKSQAAEAAPIALAPPRPFWKSPWWATPILGGVMMLETLEAVRGSGLDVDMALLLPIAVLFGYWHGRLALWPVALALLPRLVDFDIDGTRLEGAPVFVAMTLFWTRFAGDADFRRMLLTVESLPYVDLAAVVLACSFSVSLLLTGDPVHLWFSYDPAWLVITTAGVIGLSRVPILPFMLALALLAVGRAIYGAPAADSAVWPGISWLVFLGAAATAIFTRAALRRLMLADEPRVGGVKDRILLARLLLVALWVMLAGVIIREFLVNPQGHDAPNLSLYELLTAVAPVIVPTCLMLGLIIRPAVAGFVFPFMVLFGISGIGIAIASQSETLLFDLGRFALWFGVAGNALLYAVFGIAIRLTAEGEWREVRSSPTLAPFTLPIDTVARWLDRRAARARFRTEAASILASSEAARAEAAAPTTETAPGDESTVASAAASADTTTQKPGVEAPDTMTTPAQASALHRGQILGARRRAPRLTEGRNMMPWAIIVASSEPDQLDALANGAHEIAAAMDAPSARVLVAGSVEEVQKRRKSVAGRTQLLIITASLRNQASGSDLQAESGLDLIKDATQEPDPPSCILVSERIEHMRTVLAMPNCEFLRVDASTDYVDQCLQLARKLEVLPHPASEASSRPPPRKK